MGLSVLKCVCARVLECVVISTQTGLKQRVAAGRTSVCVPTTDYRARR